MINARTRRFETPAPRWRAVRAITSSAIWIVCLAVTTPLAAQNRQQPWWMFEGFAARKEPAASPLFGGFGISRYHRAWGLRLGGGMDLHTEEIPGTQVACGRYGCQRFAQNQINVILDTWTVDVDLLLEPGRTVPVLKTMLFGVSPYAFVGIGGYGAHVDGGPDTSIGTWSYGLGARHALWGLLGMRAEARWRNALETDHGFSAFRNTPEYSVGLTLSWGSRRRAAVPPAASPEALEESRARFAAGVLDVAESYLNAPYLAGGASPDGGFDAAGFVQYVFGRAGVPLPRGAREIAGKGESVSLRIGSLRPGDLLFFANDRSHIDHVAIYAGHDRILHATASGGGVRYDVLGTGDRGVWFADHLVSARRVIGRPEASSGDPPNKAYDRPDLAPPASR